MMTSKQRLLTAIERKVPDRLPVTTHHVMPYFLDKYLDGISNDEFFAYFGLDPIHWTNPLQSYGNLGKINPFIDKGTDDWRIECEEIADLQYHSVRYSIHTPKGVLTTVIQSNPQTSWVREFLVKEKKDIDLIGEYGPTPLCDVDAVNADVDRYGEKALIRGHICCFDLFGQPGCWQDACCIVGTEKMIMATYDDPQWVHELLKTLQRRKAGYVRSLKGARYDILEFGGGDASSTVISPKIFNAFVAPYDAPLIEMAHQAGQKIVYHTCGGMMPLLEDIAAMGPDAMETFTPPGMGADVDLGEAKQRIGDQVCMIGGFDQFHYFKNCPAEETRAAVRRCFEQAGENGGFILAPSDHFFDAEVELIRAFADEARRCIY